MKISKREQMLLWALVNVGVLLIGVRLLIPKVNHYYQSSIQTLMLREEQQLLANNLLLEEETIPIRLTKYEEEKKRLESPYFSRLDLEYIQSWIIKISKMQAINIKSMTIEEPRTNIEEKVDKLPIALTLEGETRAITAFIHNVLNSNRHVVVEELSLSPGVASIQLVLYRTDKMTDELEQTPFNLPIGKPFFMN